MTTIGRPKEFDRDEALGKAMELFWSRGYEATQLREGSPPPGLFERFLEQPSDLVGITVALAALIVLGISGLRARSEPSTQG